MEEERGGRREMERRGGRGACIEKREGWRGGWGGGRGGDTYLDVSKKGLVTILHVFIFTLQVCTHTKQYMYSIM